MRYYRGVVLRQITVGDDGLILYFDDVHVHCAVRHLERRARNCLASLRNGTRLDIEASEDEGTSARAQRSWRRTKQE